MSDFICDLEEIQEIKKESVISNIKATVTVTQTTDKFELKVALSEPNLFGTYYSDKSPNHAFIYRRVLGQGDDRDIFVKVFNIGDMESIAIDADSLKEDDELYRTNTYTAVFSDIQNVTAAREVLLHDLYTAYNNIAAVFQNTKQINESTLIIPTQTNDQVRKWIGQLKIAKQQQFITNAMIRAKKEEIKSLDETLLKSRVYVTELNVLTLTMKEMGNPSALVASARVFDTFLSSLEAIDRMHTHLTEQADLDKGEAEDIVGKINELLNDAIGYRNTIAAEYTESIKMGIENAAATSACCPFTVTLGASIKSSNGAFQSYDESVVAKLGEIASVYTTLVIPRLNILSLNSQSIVAESQEKAYNTAKVSITVASTALSKMLLKVSPMIVSLSDLSQSMDTISGRIITRLADAKEELRVSEEETAPNIIATIDALVLKITGYIPNFSENDPMFTWCVNITLPKE